VKVHVSGIKLFYLRKNKSTFALSDRVIKSVPRWETITRAFKFVENPIPVIDEAIATYGETYYTRIIGGRKIVMSREPAFAQHVLQKGNKKYQKSELQTDSLGKYVGLGLLTANGDYWLRQRRLIQPAFHKAKLSALVSAMDHAVREFMDELEVRVKANPEIDISEAMMELTLRVVSKALFSSDIDTDQIVELGRTINELQTYIVKDVRMPMLKWWRKLNGTSAKALKISKETRQILLDLIQDRRKSDTQHDDLLDMLLNSTYEDTGESMTDTQMLDEALILYVAGYETTAMSLGWSIHALREDPEIRKKLQEALIDHPGPHTMESLMRPDYITQVIEETMRKYPPAWILDRVVLEDDVIDGVPVSKGDLVGLYVYGTHHNPNFWEEPSKFDPDRFTPENKKKMASYAYFPFGGGPRMCIGYHFAMLEMKIALIEFFKRFSLPAPSHKEPDYMPLITLKPSENIRLELVVSNYEEVG